MALLRPLSTLAKASPGRERLWTAVAVAALAVLMAITTLPASAGAGPDTSEGVTPTEISYGGGSGACDFIDSDAMYELHINNPMTGTYTGPDGTMVHITVDAEDEFFAFEFLNNPANAAFEVVVNGGSQNTLFDYDGSVGPRRSDGVVEVDGSITLGLHAPTKGGSSNLYKLSHINICYDEAPICGQTLTVEEGIWDATVTFFEFGNAEEPCENKTGLLFLDVDGTLNLPLFGPGSAAAIAEITKTFAGTSFTPLQYSQGTADVNPAPDGFEDVPWCVLRIKLGADGNQFDPYLDDDTMYPSLAGVTDPVSGDASVACKVFVSENAEGIQLNVLLIQDDPRFK